MKILLAAALGASTLATTAAVPAAASAKCCTCSCRTHRVHYVHRTRHLVSRAAYREVARTEYLPAPPPPPETYVERETVYVRPHPVFVPPPIYVRPHRVYAEGFYARGPAYPVYAGWDRHEGWRGEGREGWRGEGREGWRGEGREGWRGEGREGWRGEGREGGFRVASGRREGGEGGHGWR